MREDTALARRTGAEQSPKGSEVSGGDLGLGDIEKADRGGNGQWMI